MSNDPNEPKIVVDDDWKERVRAEREAARQARQAQQTATDGPAADPDSASRARGSDEFALLVSMWATQALVALGKMPDPVEGHVVVRPDHAKRAIGVLSMLEEKTKGNLNAEEKEMLDQLLHELRMLYVEVYKDAQQSSPANPPNDQTESPSQE